MHRAIPLLLLLLTACASTKPAPVADVAIELDRGRPLIPLRINGSAPLPFLLDTASQTPNLRGAADPASFHFKIIGIANVGGAGSGKRKQAKLAGNVEISIGTATFMLAELVVPDRPAPPEPPLSTFGVIGKPLFDRYVVEIDWTARRVRLYEPDTFRPPHDAAALPLTFDDAGLPYVTASLTIAEGAFPVSLSLDTGANLALGLDVGSDPRITPPVAAAQTTLGHGVQGALRGTVGRVRRLRLGDHDLMDIETDFAAAGSPFVGTPGSHGLIGAEILQRFRVTLDVPNGRVFLAR
ncbi:MAG TPA: hypothetical protein VEK79_11075 [Thermoanaerobaculia bacterium]|nr:hypothetical protein [Thermoanaerobaculia bacterium]